MSTVIEWKDAKTIKNKHKFLVFGYIRNHFKNDIPESILFMILLFYYAKEYFDKIGSDTIVSNNKLTITKTGGHKHWDNSTYCANWIYSLSDTITKWLIRIDKNFCDIAPQFIFGIVSVDNVPDADFSEHNKGKYYVFGNNASYHSSHSAANVAKDKWYTDGTEFDIGDTIEITLDLKKRKFVGRVNKRMEENVVWSDIECGLDIKYKLAVGMHAVGNQITLLEYEQNN